MSLIKTMLGLYKLVEFRASNVVSSTSGGKSKDMNCSSMHELGYSTDYRCRMAESSRSWNKFLFGFKGLVSVEVGERMKEMSLFLLWAP